MVLGEPTTSDQRHLKLLSKAIDMHSRNTFSVFLELSQKPLARCEARTTREGVSAQTRVGRSICLDIYYGRPHPPASLCTTETRLLFYGELTTYIAGRH